MIEVPEIIELYKLTPVLVLIATIGLILLAALFLRPPAAGPAFAAITAAGLAAAVISAVKLMPPLRAATGPSVESLIGVSIIFDPLFLFTIIFLSGFMLGLVVLAGALWRRGPWEWPVFWCLLLSSLVGMVLMAATRHLIFFAIAFELVSLPAYVLVGFRRFNPKAVEGAAKYIIFGAVCSAVMVYGISLLYGLTGTFDMQKIGVLLAGRGFPALKGVALLCLLVGLGFKISLVPMHFWTPDVFEAAGADVAAWLSVASKSAAIIALGRFVGYLLLPAGAPFGANVIAVLTLLAVLTMTVANLSAYWQTSVKRLLAYSSIAHAGYIVCGTALLPAPAGMAAIIAYLTVYALMNLGAFAVTGLIEQQTGSDAIENFAGLGSRSPALSVLLMVFLFSLVGLPPLAGFAVKWILVAALWQEGRTLLVVAILINTLISLFYYLRIARAAYFEKATLPAFQAPAELTGLLSVLAAGLLVIFIAWGLLNQLSIDLVRAAWG